MGAAVNALPGGEIVPALDRGLLDAAEFNNATSDRTLGFPDVSKICMLQSFHQNAEQFEILFNKGKYDALPESIKSIIDNAVEAAQRTWLEGDRPLLAGLHRAEDKDRRQVLQDARRDPAEPARGLGQGRRQEVGGKSAVQGDPGVAEGVCRAGAALGQDNMVNRRMAYNHYFGAKGAASKA